MRFTKHADVWVHQFAGAFELQGTSRLQAICRSFGAISHISQYWLPTDYTTYKSCLCSLWSRRMQLCQLKRLNGYSVKSRHIHLTQREPAASKVTQAVHAPCPSMDSITPAARNRAVRRSACASVLRAVVQDDLGGAGTLIPSVKSYCRVASSPPETLVFVHSEAGFVALLEVLQGLFISLKGGEACSSYFAGLPCRYRQWCTARPARPMCWALLTLQEASRKILL